MNKKITIYLIAIFGITCLPYNFTSAQSNLATRLSGRILLQVQTQGQAWYVNPTDLKKYYLGRPADAFSIMKKLSTGISNTDLLKIPVADLTVSDADADGDGLSNATEAALGTDANKKDTDGDGYEDAVEIFNNYSPTGPEKINIDLNFSKLNAGKLFLQTEHAGECWYVNPVDNKRYFLGRPDDAFIIMRNLGLGITNKDLDQITTGQLPDEATPPASDNDQTSADSTQVINSAASAIRANDKEKTTSYFTANLKKSLEYSMDHLSAESKLLLGNILSGAKLSSSTDTRKTYTNEVYFNGEKVIVKFYVEKQADGSWLMINL